MDGKKRAQPRTDGGQPPGQRSRLQDLVRGSGLIFAGTVIEPGKSSVPAVRANPNLLTVRLDRSLRSDPVLGDLRGKTITVATQAPGALQVGDRAVFLTNSWIHGRGIAVREVEHLDMQDEGDVAAAVDELPRLHLMDRLRSAELVADAEVVQIRPAQQRGPERKAALWAEAELRIRKVLKGEPAQSTRVYFPTAEWPPWTNAPRFTQGQKGVFILHAPAQDRSLSERSLAVGSLVALDPADSQDESELEQVTQLLNAVRTERGAR
jgi:hypothetical protein